MGSGAFEGEDATCRLRVEMHDGCAYTYQGAPPHLWVSLRDATSQGRAYGDSVACRFEVAPDAAFEDQDPTVLRTLRTPSDVVRGCLLRHR